jgi:Protein of unknown function (DUF3237)
MTITSPSPALHDMPVLDTLRVEHLFDMRVEFEPPRVIPTPLARRLTFTAKGGRIEGPRLRGEVLGGGDWVLVGSDGIARMDIRSTIRTEDGALIHYAALGVTVMPDDGMDRLQAGERLSFDEIYGRTTPRFETYDIRYAWLNGVIAIGLHELSKDHIDYRVYRML